MQYDNVFIFGAGVSADAGIPLLGGFVETMWRFAAQAKAGKVSREQNVGVFFDAEKIRQKFEKYNSRASFNIRNIEDVLSLLSFEAMLGGEAAEDYEKMVKAVAQTIELSCKIPFRDPNKGEFKQTSPYNHLWHAILENQHLKNSYPALITFNYDLVLERSLWEYLHVSRGESRLPDTISCCLRYSNGSHDFYIQRIRDPLAMNPTQFVYDKTRPAEIEIPYLKLHGSLNWPNHGLTGPDLKQLTPPKHLTDVVANPLILPPVFNKMNAKAMHSVWGEALRLLRSAKHITIVGYSLREQTSTCNTS
jgi:hypothetical protein